MGLDMYLERYPRYKHYGPEDIHVVESYYEWMSEGKAGEYTLEQWCGVKEESLPNAKDMEYLKGFIITQYWEWDEEHRFPHDRIYEQVAYWRKANAIHRWFVENVQDGEDDCCYHREVTKRDLEELRDTCKEVLVECVLVKGKVKNGSTLENGKWVPFMEDGLVVANPVTAHELLPVQDGFFFGSTDYNEWYINDVRYTYNKIVRILEEMDFEKQMLYYCSSW